MTTQGTVETAMRPNPEVISAYGHGWKMLWKQFGWLLLIIFISWVISWASSFTFTFPATILNWNGIHVSPFWGVFSFVFNILIMGPVLFGVSYAYLKAARGQQVEVKDMFMAFLNYGNAVLAYFLTALIIIVGFALLIIPGIFFVCKLAFVPYLIVDKKLDGMQAIETSWKMTNGYGWQVFLIGLLAIPIMLAGFICFGIGAIISGMWISAALASLFYAVDSRGIAPASPVSPTAAPTGTA